MPRISRLFYFYGDGESPQHFRSSGTGPDSRARFFQPAASTYSCVLYKEGPAVNIPFLTVLMAVIAEMSAGREGILIASRAAKPYLPYNKNALTVLLVRNRFLKAL